MRWLGVCVVLWLCSGCMRGGAAQTLFSIGSAAVATEDLQPQACLFVIGTIGGWRGMQMIIAHGGVSIEECVRLHQYIQPAVSLPPSP